MPRPRVSPEARSAQQRELEPIFRYMEEHGIKLVWLASRIGMSSARLSNYRRGKHRPPPGTVERLIVALGSPPELARPPPRAPPR
jgi:transcriptional regulator with XRE-family HTH domain